MDARQLLVDTHPHLPPAATLSSITPADALRRVAGLPHSIADIVAHMAYWQEWFTARCEGRAVPMAASAAEGWPAVGGDAWPMLADRFVAGLDRLADVVARHEPDAPIAPAMELPMVAGYSFRDVWEHVAQHNAHHLGQVVVIRQILGIWPPPSGSYTW
jgi:uncharacterized damage-inducible protein DinB